jgi:acetyl-CoA carboxylase biotin carboxylase subunit
MMTDELRVQMGEAAVKLAKACNYKNAGTIEFLVDSERNFYFLEMNTRLQVEHPITEMVTGIDLVKEQIRIAYGEALRFRQQDISWRGSAIECRIYAEDPENSFFPSPGKIKSLRVPAGPGIRDDSGIYEGWTIPIFYDPLLSKLVAWGNDRQDAIQKMRRALAEYQVSGIKTTIPFFQSLLAHERFLDGALSTDFIDKYRPHENLSQRSVLLQEVAIIAAALYASRNNHRNVSPVTPGESPWKVGGRLDGLRNK